MILTAMTVAALLVGGMGAALLGSVKVAWARKLQMDEARIGGLVSIFGLTMVPGMFAAGFLTDLPQVGPRGVLMSGSVIMGASLVLVAYAHSYLLAFMAVILLSAGWSLLINVSFVLMKPAFGGDDVFAFNLGNVFFGLGAFLTPLAVIFLLRQFPFRLAIGLLAVLALMPAILTLGADFSILTRAATTAGDPGLGRLLGNPILWLCGFALFFYASLEASMGAWSTTYLGDKGVSEGAASGWLSAFWLAFMGTRLATALIVFWWVGKSAPPPGLASALVLALSLACIGAMTSMVLGRGRKAAVGTVVAAGLLFGPIFPTIQAILYGSFEEALHGRANGLFFSIGGIGWTIIPMMIGAYARRTSVQRGFSIAVAAAAGLSAVAAAMMLYKG